MTASKPPLILVLGMHRSGTSLLGSLLQALGVALPGQLISADHHNPEGYYEWQEVVDLQERLLIDLDRWWPSAQGCLPLPEGWLQHPATLHVREQLRALLQRVALEQQGPWAIKDPRTSRLLPLWLELADELAIPLRPILAVRDPAEVVRSLLERDGSTTGMDVVRAQALWWRHNLEVVHGLSKAPPVLDYAAWFSRPEFQLKRLLQAIPELQATPDQQRAALQLIRPEHRRSLVHAEQFALQRKVRALHRRLLRSHVHRWPGPELPRTLQPQQLLSALPAPSAWLACHQAWRCYPAPRYSGDAALAAVVQLRLFGRSGCHWQAHLWCNKLPIPALGSAELSAEQPSPQVLALQVAPQAATSAGFERIALNVELPAPDRADAWLEQMRQQQAIWDPDPARVHLMRRLGLPAYWLDAAAPANGWLLQPGAADPKSWVARLGIAAPAATALVVLGAAGAAWDRQLAQQEACAAQQPPLQPLLYYPNWFELLIEHSADALAQAGWLWAGAAQAQALVWISAELDPALAALAPLPAQRLCQQLPVMPADLRARASGLRLMVSAEDRPSPPHTLLFHWSSPAGSVVPPQAAVLVSLFNYADRIEAALASVAAQTQQQLELIVIDDASTDRGAEAVQAWMQAQLEADDHPFVRMQLIRHGCNAGLATARNTAFSEAQSPWCFVLDADNALYPDALAACLALAQSGPATLGVVHPLLAIERESGNANDQGALVSVHSWQRQRFCHGNYVDAMALVRRAAWQAVGGYTHIEAGWEDYDFWCKLAEAGWLGLQCPRVLAVYRSHANSMTQATTTFSQRALYNTLQQRHLWLQLPVDS